MTKKPTNQFIQNSAHETKFIQNKANVKQNILMHNKTM